MLVQEELNSIAEMTINSMTEEDKTAFAKRFQAGEVSAEECKNLALDALRKQIQIGEFIMNNPAAKAELMNFVYNDLKKG